MKSENKKKVVGQYEIFLDRRLGSGGFGQVYQGYNTKTKETVAIKMIERINNGNIYIYNLRSWFPQIVISN